ncbi:hypothetical protein [Rhodococcus jostii]|uniref:hypothetical protein n=1 Tax=Rhodococcus jostii TaxID=132919 RepID=UPI00365CA9B5
MKPTTHHATIRKTLWSTLSVVTVAGTLFTGTGISDATTGASDATISTLSGKSYHWDLTNRTGQPISGNWQISLDSQRRSVVERDQAHPWKIGESDGAFQEEDSVWGKVPIVEGNICYDKHWWSYRVHSTGTSYSLEADTNHTLHVRYKEGHHDYNNAFDSKSDPC